MDEVITEQPASAAPVQPNELQNCRPGFEPLLDLDHLFLKQRRTDRAMNTANEYKILSPTGKQIFTANENTDNMQLLLGPSRQTTFNLNIGQILKLQGELGTCSTPAVVRVRSRGQLIGSAIQTGNVCAPKYVLKDRSGYTGITIDTRSISSCCLCCKSMRASTFRIFSTGDEGPVQVGSIEKKFAGIFSEVVTTADSYVIRFPAEMDVTMKALLLSAAILIDFQHFEQGWGC